MVALTAGYLVNKKAVYLLPILVLHNKEII